MKVSELVFELEALWANHGDVDVVYDVDMAWAGIGIEDISGGPVFRDGMVVL